MRTPFIPLALFCVAFVGLVLLLQGSMRGEPDPSGAQAAFRFLDPEGKGMRHPDERNPKRLRRIGLLLLAAGIGGVVLWGVLWG